MLVSIVPRKAILEYRDIIVDRIDTYVHLV